MGEQSLGPRLIIASFCILILNFLVVPSKQLIAPSRVSHDSSAKCRVLKERLREGIELLCRKLVPLIGIILRVDDIKLHQAVLLD